MTALVNMEEPHKYNVGLQGNLQKTSYRRVHKDIWTFRNIPALLGDTYTWGKHFKMRWDDIHTIQANGYFWRVRGFSQGGRYRRFQTSLIMFNFLSWNIDCGVLYTWCIQKTFFKNYNQQSVGGRKSLVFAVSERRKRVFFPLITPKPPLMSLWSHITL